jgi:hypothetical protein
MKPIHSVRLLALLGLGLFSVSCHGDDDDSTTKATTNGPRIAFGTGYSSGNYEQLGFIHSTDKGTSFSTEANINTQVSGEGVGDVSIVVDQTGITHILYLQEDWIANTAAVFYTRSTDGGQTFSTPQSLSTGGVYFPLLEVDPTDANKVYAVFSGYDKAYFTHSVDGGLTFHCTHLLSTATGVDTKGLAVDLSGNIYVLLDEENAGSKICISTDGGTNFIGTTFDANGNQSNYGVQVSTSGVAHIILEYGNTLYHYHNTGGLLTWTGPTQVDTSTVSNSVAYAKLALDSNGNPHVVYRESDGSDLRSWYNSSSDGGITWDYTSTVDKTIDNSGGSGGWSYPQIEIDSSDNLHFLFLQNDGTSDLIYYNRSTDSGLSFETPTRVSLESGTNRDGSCYGSSIVADSSGNIHVTFKQEDGENGTSYPYYHRSTDGGTTWKVSDRMLLSPNASSSYIKMAIAP